MTIHDGTLAPPGAGVDRKPRPKAERRPATLRRRRAALFLAPALALAILAGVLAGRALSPDTQAPARAPAVKQKPQDLALRQQLPHVIGALNQARISDRALLSHAHTPAAQAQAARSLAAAHLEAADSLRSVPGAAKAALVDRLAATARAYSDLAQAAGTGSVPGFAAARQDVARAEEGVRQALPTSPKATRSAPTAPLQADASQPSRTAVILALAIFAVLGAGLALFQVPERIVTAGRTALIAQTARRQTAPQADGPRPARPASAPEPGAPWPAEAPAPSARTEPDDAPTPAPVKAAPADAPVSGAPKRAPAPRARRAAKPTSSKRTAAPAAAKRAKGRKPARPAAKPPAMPAPAEATATRAPTTPAATETATTKPAPSDAATTKPAPSDAATTKPAAGTAAASDGRATTSRVGAAPSKRKVLHGRANGRRAGASSLPPTGWACEIVWSANLFGAGFHAKAAAPGQKASVIARSPKVDHPPLVPPKPDPDLVAAARTLVRALRDAGWQPVSPGNRWYAQRFVWAGEQDPQPLPPSCPAPPPTRPRRSRGPRA